ncbi:MAG: type II toxin-antitoxin system HipA family toxin [Myxococcota bacterium]
MTRELVTLLAGRRVGVVQRAAHERLRFTYYEDWRGDPQAVPLSLSMPLAAREHGPDRVEPFLWNLLPDNEAILQAWGKRFRVSPRNVFGLLSHVGADCAGAVQLVSPERVEAMAGDAPPQVQWLDDAEVAARLRELRRDRAAWRRLGDTGQFSLAGAQPKTALLYDGRRWGIPSGRTPTTHILKPPMAGVEGHAENEHLCLNLARAIGLPAARSWVARFEDEVAIVIARYDRVRISESDVSAIVRVHQEDMCQALGLGPGSKYQNEGGPSPADIVALLRDHSTEPGDDIGTFVDALAFNWLVGGTDAHAKNYSMLHASGSRARLAPLYDIASALPYPDLQVQKLKLAMKIGGRYRLRDVGPRQWEALAEELGLGPRTMLDRVADLGERMANEVGPVCDEARDAGLTDPLVPRLHAALEARARSCVERIEAYEGP